MTVVIRKSKIIRYKALVNNTVFRVNEDRSQDSPALSKSTKAGNDSVRIAIHHLLTQQRTASQTGVFSARVNASSVIKMAVGKG